MFKKANKNVIPVNKTAGYVNEQLYQSITTRGFKHRMNYPGCYQQNVIRQLIRDYPNFIRCMVDNRIYFDWKDGDQGKLSTRVLSDGAILYGFTGWVAFHFKQDPSTNMNVFPAFLRHMAVLLHKRWLIDINNRWMESSHFDEDVAQAVIDKGSTLTQVNSLICYDGYCGSIACHSIADAKSHRAEISINEVDSATLECTVPITQTEDETLKAFMYEAYTSKGVCTFSSIDHYDSFINAPEDCQYHDDIDIDSTQEIYVGGRLSGTTIST